jgi:hypothetical protein
MLLTVIVVFTTVVVTFVTVITPMLLTILVVLSAFFTLMPHLDPFWPEMPAPVVIPVMMIAAIFMIAIITDPVNLVPSDRRRELFVAGHHPGTVIMVGPIPVITLKEVIHAGNKNHVVGHINPHIEPQRRRRQKKWRGIKDHPWDNRWRGRHRHAQINIDVEMGFCAA